MSMDKENNFCGSVNNKAETIAALLPDPPVRPVCVYGSDDLVTAISKMVKYNFSQLPVLNHATPTKSGEKGAPGPLLAKDVKGVISWKSIGEAALSRQRLREAKVSECVMKVPILEDTMPIPKVLEQIDKDEFALVMNAQRQMYGIVTYADIASSYIQLIVPYTQIRGIEQGMRRILSERLSVEQLRTCVRAERRGLVSSVDDLELFEEFAAFGEYWDELQLPFARNVFFEDQALILEIRNRTMISGRRSLQIWKMRHCVACENCSIVRFEGGLFLRKGCVR